MIPATLSTWIDAHIAHMTYGDVAIWCIVPAILAVAAGWGIWIIGKWLVEQWMIWRIRCCIRKTRKRQVWPIPFVETPIPHRDPWPLRVVLVFATLVISIWWRCGR